MNDDFWNVRCILKVVAVAAHMAQIQKIVIMIIEEFAFHPKITFLD